MSALQIENRDGALWVTFNRPELFNSLSPESICGMLDMWQRAEEDDTVKLVVLTGAGDRAFCAGADLKLTIPLLSGARAPETEHDHYGEHDEDDNHDRLHGTSTSTTAYPTQPAGAS